MLTTMVVYIKKILKPILLFIFKFFFDSKYLKGRHFNDSYSGMVFCIKSIWQRNILRLAKPLPWPVLASCSISSYENITFDVDNIDNFQSPGTYFQNIDGHITLGKGVYIAPNVGIITSNHDPFNLDLYLPAKDVFINENCWLGMNSVILPGVRLGANTIVGAGSVVTKSFPAGNVIIAGNPAKKIRELNDYNS